MHNHTKSNKQLIYKKNTVNKYCPKLSLQACLKYSLQLIMAWWRHMASEILIDTGSGNDLLPDGIKPLPEPMMTHHN